jgi:PAS domain S-box-containing protein
MSAVVASGEWLVGGGETGRLIRAMDWSHTPLGPRADWSPSLRTVVQLVVETRFPMALLWGPEFILLYNDAFRIIAADRHPAAMGRGSREVWPEVWDINEPILAAVTGRGETIYLEDKCFPIDRNGRREDAFFTLCYSPVRDAAGAVVGTLVVLQETTTQVAERRRLEQERERALDAFENGDPCAVLDSQFRYVLVNRAQEASSGKRRDEILGRRIWDVWPEAADRRFQFWDVYHRVMRDRVPEQFEEHFPPLDLWAEINVVPTSEGGIAAFFRRINDRKKAQAALRASEEKFGKAFHANVAGVAITRLSDGCYLDVNDRLLELTGFRRDELVGTTSSALVWKHPEDRARFVRGAREGSGASAEYVFLRSNGEEWIGLVSAHVIEIEDQPVVVSSVIDITERKRAEDLLQVANSALAEADRQKDEFIAILSHELRNPLAPIRYALPVLEREPIGETARRAVQVIGRQVEHLTHLVDDLLDVSRITRGKIDLRPEQVTLESLVSAAVEAASPAIAAARHSLEIAVSDEPVWLRVDRARMTQVLTNLLNNSAKYTPRGGRIEIDACREEGRAVVRVRDNGMGIPADALPHVFGMFRQVDRPDKSQGGLGIGLGLVKRLVEMHGGSVEASSEGCGQGAEFVVAVPVADDPGPGEDQPEAGQPMGDRSLKVLVVDDNADLADMLGLVVRAAGHDVRKALDGRSAISAARAFRPDVVLLDLGLPVLNGIEVGRELRRMPETAGARLVALTGWGQADDRRQTRDAGFDDHLTKPTDPARLIEMLRDFAARSGGR